MIDILPEDLSGVVYVRNAKEMAMAVLQLLKSPEKQSFLGQKGFAFVKKHYASFEITSQLEGHLHELVNKTE